MTLLVTKEEVKSGREARHRSHAAVVDKRDDIERIEYRTVTLNTSHGTITQYVAVKILPSNDIAHTQICHSGCHTGKVSRGRTY